MELKLTGDKLLERTPLKVSTFIKKKS